MTAGRPADLLAADRQGRLAAQTEFDRPVILEAGAGTGKTATLVARVLAWSLGRGWQEAAGRTDREGGSGEAGDRVAAAVLGGIVAVTFTEAAAAEMEARLASALSLVAAAREAEIAGFDPAVLPDPGAPDERRRRARALLGALDHLTVRTLHSYCRHLLARYPLEAGLHPELTVDADLRLVEEIVRGVVEGAAREAYAGPGEEPLLALAGRGYGPRSVAEALRELVERGLADELLAADPFEPGRVGAAFERLREALESLRGAFRVRSRRGRARKLEEVTAAVRETLELVAALSEPGLEAADRLCRFLAERWSPDLLARLRAWEKQRFVQAEKTVFGDRLEGAPAAAGRLRRLVGHLAAIDVRLLDLGRRALRPLLAAVAAEMRSRGVVTFATLLREARDLLASHAGARAREQARLSQLLVDEMQDTDRTQIELVRLLALEGPPERRPGLFVVGDPKQSIFGWRDADLEAYAELVERARAAGGERYRLVENFRSVPAVLDEVERAIRPVMVARAGLQPAYEPLLPCARLAGEPGFVRQGRAPVEHWVSWQDDQNARPGGAGTTVAAAAALEARAVAADIRELHDREGLEWKDFGILFRATGHLDTYLDALRGAGVPFVVARDKSYFRRREVIEAAALVRAIVDPVDHLALLAFLRSAAVGVPDAALLPLWRQRFPELVTELDGPDPERLEGLRAAVEAAVAELPAAIPGLERVRGWERNLLAAIHDLARLRQAFAREPPDRFIDLVRRRVLLEATEAARYLGEFRAANLERFFRQLEAALEAGAGDVLAVLRSLRRAVSEAQEAEEALPKDAAEDAVRVFTIHTAKGLEFRHAYVVQLHGKPGRSERRSVDADERWQPEGVFEYRLFGSATPAFDRVEERRRRVEAAERARTLYVAMTRARERLVLVGRWPAAPAPGAGGGARTHLGLLLHRQPLPPSIAEMFEDCRRRGVASVDAAAARWRFPVLDPALATTAAPARVAAPPDAKRVRRDVALLADRRAAAAARMERPFYQAASEEVAERLDRMAEQRRGEPPDGSRLVAMAVGTAVHRLFETWDLDRDPDEELERQETLLEARLRARLPDPLHEPARARAGELFDRLRRGSLLPRFLGLADRIVARETPVLLRPDDPESGPTGFVAGAVDLIYREPETDALVIVDFKTDRLELDLELELRAEVYRPQEALYGRALQRALDLAEPPRGELWFLWADRVLPLPAGTGR